MAPTNINKRIARLRLTELLTLDIWAKGSTVAEPPVAVCIEATLNLGIRYPDTDPGKSSERAGKGPENCSHRKMKP